MAIATIATVITAAAAAASLANMGYQAAQGAPATPNLNSSSQEVAQAQANALPYELGLAQAEQQGTSALRYGYTQETYSQQQQQQAQAQVASLQKQLASLPPAPGYGQPDPSGWLRGPIQQQLNQAQQALANIPQGGGTVYKDSSGNIVPKTQAVADFTGFGTADVQGKIAGQMAGIETQLQQKYGPAFASQALANAEQSDPAGFAARNQELQMIRGQEASPMPINPLSTTLDQQVLSRLNANGGLTDMDRTLLDQAVSQANAARNGGTTADQVATDMSTGQQGEARRQAAEAAAGSYLSSGATPEDVQYKREQQMLSNLGSFVAGQTPESQFRNLSGAASGAAPFYGAQQAPSMPSSAASVGPAYSVGAWQRQLQGQMGQANGWLGGLSGLLSATGALGKTLGTGTGPGG